jgi:hypothetical protein
MVAAMSAHWGQAAAPSGADVRALMISAIDAFDGRAGAELDGAAAQKIRDAIGEPKARILVEITTVKRFKQEGCSRLKVRFTAPETRLKTSDGGTQPMDWAMTLNMCKNGMPPSNES